MMLLNYMENVYVKRLLILLLVVNCVFFIGTLLHADLFDCGEDGELFYDSQTRLYWYDPGTFAGWTQDKIDAFIHEHTLWNWAGHDQMLDLAGVISAGSCSSLTDVLGAETYTYDSFYCWVGFIDPQDTYVAVGIGSDWDSAGIQLYISFDHDPGKEDDTFISGTILNGAWLYSMSDPLEYTAPVPEPSTIFLIGTGLIGLAGVMRKFGKK